VTDRKLFETNTLIDEFIQKLTKIGTLDGGWATKYIDNSTGIQTCNKTNVILIAIKRYFFEKRITKTKTITG